MRNVTVVGIGDQIEYPDNSLTINAGGITLFSLNSDGTLTYGPNFKPSGENAEMFFNILMERLPKWLNNIREYYKDNP